MAASLVLPFYYVNIHTLTCQVQCMYMPSPNHPNNVGKLARSSEDTFCKP